MNKTDLINKVAELSNLSKKDAGIALDAVLDAISDSLISLSNEPKGGSIQLVGFGTYKVTPKPARKGRNPSTGQEIDIAASNKVSFTPGATLKNAVNK
jgi:DNA-binding protein HU-beta